jgi:hypothetical protein
MEQETQFHPTTAEGIVQTLAALQEQIMRMQERHEAVFKNLQEQGMLRDENYIPQGESHVHAPVPMETTLSPREGRTGPKPAAPADFEGDRTKGRAFLNSVQWYMRSRGHEFRDTDHKVAWTLSFMKSGRALTFVNQITRQTEKQGHIPYETWSQFWKELEKRFLPIDESEEAINTLETDRYYQGKLTVDDYCDKFQDLVDHAGYTEGRQIVIKFRKGLESEIADKVALLQEKRPSDDDVSGWIDTAKEIARQRTRNEAFNQSVRRDKPPLKTSPPAPVKGVPFFRVPPFTTFQTRSNPTVAPKPQQPAIHPFPAAAPPPIPPKPPASGPIPMEIDSYTSRGRTPVICHRCGKAGHFKSQCPQRFDVRYMSTDEIEDHLQEHFLQQDVAVIEEVEEREQTKRGTEEKEAEEKGFVERRE